LVASIGLLIKRSGQSILMPAQIQSTSLLGEDCIAAIVLVHGAWGGGRAWKRLVPQQIRLSNSGVDSMPRTFIRCPVNGAVWAGIYDPREPASRRWG